MKFRNWVYMTVKNKKLTNSTFLQSIIVDSNIIQYSADKNRSKSTAYFDLFTGLKDQSNELTISEITIAENLHALYGKKYIKAYKHISQFVKIIVAENVLLLAAKIGGLYYEEGFRDIEICDKIIAATAILEKSLVLTRNHKHFPPPFFEPFEWIQVKYKMSGKYRHTDDVCIYKPRYELIIRRIEEKNNSGI